MAQRTQLGASDDLDGWNGRVEGRAKREGMYVYTQLMHFTVQRC